MIRKGAIGEGSKKLSKESLEEFGKEMDRQFTPEQRNWFLYGGTLNFLDIND